jgi:hypothetical protein
LDFGLRFVFRVHQDSDRRGMRPQFTQQPQPLRLYFGNKRTDTREVATGTMQASDQAAPDRVGAAHEDDWYGRGRCLGDNDGHLLTHEIGGESRQSIVLAVSPTIVDGDVLTFDKACFIETLANDCNERCIDDGRTAAEQSDHR